MLGKSSGAPLPEQHYAFLIGDADELLLRLAEHDIGPAASVKFCVCRQIFVLTQWQLGGVQSTSNTGHPVDPTTHADPALVNPNLLILFCVRSRRGRRRRQLSAEQRGPAVLAILPLGAKHMVTGYDHLLFLGGVIFFVSRLRDVGIYVSFRYRP